MKINTNSAVWHIKYITWIWTSDARERRIDDSSQADWSTKIWQGACKDIKSLDMEENETISLWNINNMVLRIILREHNCDFHHRTGGMWRSSVRCSSRLGASKSCRRNNLSLSNWMFTEEISNISNLNLMKSIDNYVLLLIVVGDMGEKALEMMRKLWPQKKRTSILSCRKFW
jgi:hypothetical protein